MRGRVPEASLYKRARVIILQEAKRHPGVPLTAFRAANATVAACGRSLAWRKARGG